MITVQIIFFIILGAVSVSMLALLIAIAIVSINKEEEPRYNPRKTFSNKNWYDDQWWDI